MPAWSKDDVLFLKKNKKLLVLWAWGGFTNVVAKVFCFFFQKRSAFPGFIEVPSLGLALREAQKQGCPVDPDTALYVGGRVEVVRGKAKDGLMMWQRLLFGFMYRNAVHTVDRFSLPPRQVIEDGGQVEILDKQCLSSKNETFVINRRSQLRDFYFM